MACQRRLTEHFRSDRRGSVAIIMALSVIPLIGIVALAVDYGRATRYRSQLQAALDAATLGAARTLMLQGNQTPESVSSFVAANFTQQVAGLSPAITAQVDANSIVRATATVNLPTTFGQVIGVSTLDLKVSSQAKFGIGAAEIALVLDNTGSMTGSKLDGLKTAAAGLVDTLYSSVTPATSLKIGLVPFTYYVNVGMSYRNAAWMDVPPDSSTTTNSCWDTYPNATYSAPITETGTCYNDGVASSCTYSYVNVLDWGAPVQACGPVTSTSTWNGCVGSRAYPLDTKAPVSGTRVPGIMNATCSSALARLSPSATAVKTQISNMVATGETYIASGLVWGWRLLAPDAPFSDGAAYSSDVQKIMVVMTDGANTKSPQYPDHEGSDVANADNLTAELCSNIKASGISIYTIAFAVADPAANQRLADCSSGPSYTYTADTTAQLNDAFKSIGQKMITVHLAK